MKEDNCSWRYTVKEGQTLKRGYTTGTCAAAAAKGAVAMLFSGEIKNRVEVYLPAELSLQLSLERINLTGEEAACCVQKDAGDDPDVTGGIEICARAVMDGEAGIKVEAGEGIGRITRPGLEVGVGEPAINPVPMRMIKQEAGKVLPPGRGARVELSIPGGKELARKTFNPRLGIEGGLSILGTTGLVEPMSNHAMQESLALELKMRAPEADEFAVLVPGNYGREVALNRLHLPANNVFKISNYAGFMLDRCVENGIKRILLVGHPGKLSKIAAGIFQTHSRSADGRFEVLAAYASLFGASQKTVADLYECINTEEMVRVLEDAGLGEVFLYLAERISLRAAEYMNHYAKVGTVLFTLQKGIIAMDGEAKSAWEVWKCQ